MLRKFLMSETALFHPRTICFASADSDSEGVDVSAAAGNAPVRKLALTFVDDLSEETNADIEATLDAKEVVKRAPLAVLADLERDHGDDLDAFPTVDAGKPDKDGNIPIPAGNNPDYYSIPGGTDSKGNRITIKGSFYADYADNTVPGKAITRRIAGIDAAEAGKSDAPAVYKRMTKDERTSAKARETQRRSDLRAIIKRAMKVYQQMRRLDEMPAIGWRVQMQEVRDTAGNVQWVEAEEGQKADDKGRALDEHGAPIPVMAPMNTPKPMVIYNKAQPERPTVLSISTFLALDVQKAKANGGKMADLLETTTRGSDEEGQSGADTQQDVGLLKNPTELYDVGVRVNHYFDDADQMAALHKLLSGKSDKRLPLVRVLGDLRVELNNLFQRESVQRDYLALCQADQSGDKPVDAKRDAA